MGRRRTTSPEGSPLSVRLVPHPPDPDTRPPEPSDRFIYTDIYGQTVIYRPVWEPLIGGGERLMLRAATRFPISPDIACKSCGSKNLVRFGSRKGTQRYLCRGCGITFMDNGAMPGMRVPPEAIGAAVSMFYGGLSIRQVSDHLNQIFDIRPSKSTIYGWIVRYTKKARGMVKDLHPRVGDTWVADETVLKVAGENTWFFDLIDEDTRFLLASYLAPGRTIRDAQTLMSRGVRMAGRGPKVIITDKLRSYIEANERTFGATARHHQTGPFALEESSRAIERFHGTLKDRTKVMRGIANRESANLLLDGWLFHYNFVRGHEGLGGETPARAARVKVPFKNWTDIVKSGGER